MFIYEKAPYPSCHASTLVEHEPGRLMAAWFGGKDEGAKDVQIWSGTFDGKVWAEPKVIGTEPGQPCWNPVLFKSAKGTLHFWYKAGPSPERWTGFSRTSTDSGKTWSKVEMMPAGFWGPVRAKPIQLANGTILAGTSVESFRNWTPFVDRSEDDGRTWTRSNAFAVPGKANQIQPALFQTKDGRVVALMRLPQLTPTLQPNSLSALLRHGKSPPLHLRPAATLGTTVPLFLTQTLRSYIHSF